MLQYDYSKQAADEEDGGVDLDLQELQIADYIVFLLALETYMGWLEETQGSVPATDPTLRRGMMLARMAERQNLDAMTAFIKSNLVSQASVSLLEAAVRPPPTLSGLATRAVKLRTVLSKGGTATTKAVFGTSTKARREVQEAIDASMIDDPDAALNKFSSLVLKNKKLEKWIDEASEVVVTPGSAVISPVQEAAKGATDASASLLSSQVQQEARPGTDQSIAARDNQAATLSKIELQATEAAKKALAKSGEEDRPLTKSEVVGVATAAATAVTSDPDNPQNVPAALQRLDPEQRGAAMTGGKVRVSAGAGSGKSTTLLARTQYLIDQGAVPNRMMAMSFNKKAADELAVKMASKIGSDKVSTSKNPNPDGVQVGTMHSTFLKYINQFGTPDQVDIFAKVNGKGGLVGASQLFRAAKDIWDECFKDIDKDPPGDPDGKERELPEGELWKMPPKSGRMMAYMNLFQGEGMSFEQVQAWGTAQGTIEAGQAVKFFEVYEGLKGGLGEGWRPNLCGNKPSPKFDKFKDFNRAGKPRVGDFNDMLTVFRDVMKANPAARKKIQEQFDHIMVDECQDLNPLQFEVLQLMTEHVQTDDPKKSFWMVGDDKQSIYQFRGADPNNFIKLDKMGFKDRQITTNYRCAPEFVDAANKLIAVNENQIPMEAKAAPNRARGEANLTVQTPQNEAAAAVEFGKKILAASRAGEPLSNFAVLARTNAELAIYQQICAVLGVKFVQKKATAVFSTQETASFRAFLQSVASTDPKAVQDSFCQTLVSGGVLRPKGVDKAEALKFASQQMKRSIQQYCSKNRINIATFDPMDEAMRRPAFLEEIVQSVGGTPAFAARDEAEKAMPLVEGISIIRGYLENPAFTTKDLFEAILGLPVNELVPPGPGSRRWSNQTKTFRKSTEERLAARVVQEEADEDPEQTDEKSSLGTLDFVQLMMQPNEADPSYNPNDPKQFHAQFEGLAEKAEELRIDPDEWEKKEAAQGIPLANRTAPPGVYLGTVHSTKGAEWSDVTLLMPKGKFPMERKPRKTKVNEIPEEQLVDPQSVMESERRLGYVGLTRAKSSLTVLCPGGPSPFIAEAGLKDGQNVPQPATTTPGAVPATAADVDAVEDPPELGNEDPFAIFDVKTAMFRPQTSYQYDRSSK